MKWEKKGLIYCPDGTHPWAKNTFLTPTPIIIDGKIRVYGGFRDRFGVSRIGYIDLDPQNPSNILKISEEPVLDIGKKGNFDDNGIILGDLIWAGDELRMYYIGFQKVSKVKFLAFTGLATSRDGGHTFRRLSMTPIMDRTDNALFIRAIHTVLSVEGKFRVWYSAGTGWQVINGTPYPKYDIRFVESSDGVTFQDREGTHCLGVNESEYRIGRPRVRRSIDGFEMRFTSDTRQKIYKSGYALSKDGIRWERKDHLTGIKVSESGWDSEMICYPVVLKVEGCEFMFYSGNGMGLSGVGYAQLVEE